METMRHLSPQSTSFSLLSTMVRTARRPLTVLGRWATHREPVILLEVVGFSPNYPRKKLTKQLTYEREKSYQCDAFLELNVVTSLPAYQ